MQTSISDAIHRLEEFLTTLDNAYWESSNIEKKDRLYDVISIFHIELRELSKLSIEDHYLAYEAISPGAHSIQNNLRSMHSQLDSWPLKSSTINQLRNDLSTVSNLLAKKP